MTVLTAVQVCGVALVSLPSGVGAGYVAFAWWRSRHVCPVFAVQPRHSAAANRAAADASVASRDWAQSNNQSLPRQRFEPSSERPEVRSHRIQH